MRPERTPRHRRFRRGGTLLTLLIVSVLAGVVVQPIIVDSPAAVGVHATVPPSRPDIVVIMTDDQRAGTQKAMPFTHSFFTGSPRSVNYTNAQVPTNLCCPSRVALLTGKYPSATGGWDNAGVFGGTGTLRRWTAATLPQRLDAVGYTTGLFGKYVNGYGSYGSRSYNQTPPGWDEFTVFDGDNGSGYRASVRAIGRGYSTDTLGEATANFIMTAPASEPLFAYYTPYAPHKTYQAGPYRGSASVQQKRDARRAGGFGNPSFNTVTSGQPQWLQSLPVVSKAHFRRIANKQTDTLMGIDANVRRIVATIAEHRDMNNTLFVFLSDNGYGWGDHRVSSKRSPYITTNEIPLMVRFPASMPVTRTGDDPRLVNNLDVTATALAAARLDVTTVDGQPLHSPYVRGFLPLMAAPTIGRKADTPPRPAYCGVRTPRWLYLRYGSGERELYDLDVDPYQLTNRASDPTYAAVTEQLSADTTSTGCNESYLQTVVGPQLPIADE